MPNGERSVFIEAISESWDDLSPILVFSDWLEERGDDCRFLRWYLREVHPAIAEAALPSDADRVFLRPQYEWRKTQRTLRSQIAKHPNSTSLFRFGAVAICGLALRRNALPETCRELVNAFRVFALGITTDEALKPLRARERDIVHRICFGMFSPKAPFAEFAPERASDADIRLFALDAANPRGNPTSIPKPFTGTRRGQFAATDVDALMFWGALHRTLADVPPFVADERP